MVGRNCIMVGEIKLFGGTEGTFLEEGGQVLRNGGKFLEEGGNFFEEGRILERKLEEEKTRKLSLF